MPPPKPEPKLYEGLLAVIGSAAAAAGTVFGLFSSLLSELVPPIDDSRITVGMASFGTAVVLLALTLVMRKQTTLASARLVAAIAAALVLCALLMFFAFSSVTRAYVYRYPPASIANPNQTRNVQGDLHTAGLALVKNGTVSQAVYRLGGPDVVNGSGMLWHEDSRKAAMNRLQLMYVCLAMLMTTAIFVAGIAVWRRQA